MQVDLHQGSDMQWSKKHGRIHSMIEATNLSCNWELPKMHERDILERLKFDLVVPCVLQWAFFGIPEGRLWIWYMMDDCWVRYN